MKQTRNAFEFNHFNRYKDSIVNNTICSVQPSRKVPPGIGSDLFHLHKILVENKNCYATPRNDVEEISTPFWNELKPDAKLQIQNLLKIFLLIRTN